MSGTCLVMAGGAGERMRRSGATVPKPLVRVAGASLLQHNVVALLHAGFDDLHIAVGAGAQDVIEHAGGTCRELAQRSGASLEVIVEERPLGSMGALHRITARDDVLVVNADNLTALDLRVLLDDHRRSGAAMTIAVHDEPFQMPYGETVLEGDRVVEYREKPTYRITVSSAVSVVGRPAADLVGPDEFLNLPDLCNRVLDEGLLLHAHRHEAPWADVNDLGVVERAEQLVAAHPDLFTIGAP